jgi:hypothetical protein
MIHFDNDMIHMTKDTWHYHICDHAWTSEAKDEARYGGDNSRSL